MLRFMISILLFLLHSNVHAAMTFGAAGVGAYSMPAASGTTGTSKLGVGGALTVDLDLSSNWGLELDSIYVQRVFGGAGSTLNVFNTVRIPLLLQYRLASFLAFKLGGFYDLLLTPLPTGFTATSDMGATAGMAIYIPFSSSMTLFLEGRYNYNLTNIASTGTLNPHDALVMLGLKLTGGGGRSSFRSGR